MLTLKYAPDGIWAFVDPKLPKSPRKVDWQDAAPLPHRAKPAAGEIVLQASNIRKEFGGLVPVNDINFSVASGQIVGLIGPNGAGKSTTFNLITGVLSLTRGSVTFRGETISSLPSREIAKRGISRTFQHVKMIADVTVLENMALGAQPGLAPLIVRKTFRTTEALRRTGVTTLLVEQNARGGHLPGRVAQTCGGA